VGSEMCIRDRRGTLKTAAVALAVRLLPVPGSPRMRRPFAGRCRREAVCYPGGGAARTPRPTLLRQRHGAIEALGLSGGGVIHHHIGAVRQRNVREHQPVRGGRDHIRVIHPELLADWPDLGIKTAQPPDRAKLISRSRGRSGARGWCSDHGRSWRAQPVKARTGGRVGEDADRVAGQRAQVGDHGPDGGGAKVGGGFEEEGGGGGGEV
jgi:hypothetical protein